ncbi:MAG: hypothetical protein MUC50_05920, partial [Myxococcota bacterium]|nr:hypothetical protein [Myxococcota bacterium]
GPGETGQGAKVADTYLDLMSDVPGKMGKFAPAGTAILVSMNSERFFPVDFSEDGKVNGVPTNEMESIADLKDVVATNVENQPRSWGAWDSDAVVDLNTVTDFYRATAIIFVNGYKSGDNRWFTETQVWTGDKESVCKVQGQWRCGIYPTEDKNIFYSTRGSDGKVNTTGWILKHGAFASAYGAKWVQAYRPGKDLWGSTDLKDNDSYEASYYNGFPMGATVGWSPFSGFSLSLSNTWRFETKGRKSMQSWDGWELQESFQYDRGKNSSGQMLKGTARRIATGVTMKYDKKKIYTGFVGGAWTNAIDFGQMIGRNTLPNHRDFCTATNKTINKPKMSWEGWMPTIAAIHEFPPSYTSVLSSSNRVLIKAGLIWERQQLKYYFSPQPGTWKPGNVYCGDLHYRRNIWLLDGRNRVELIDPPTTKKTYQAYKEIYLAHTKF